MSEEASEGANDVPRACLLKAEKAPVAPRDRDQAWDIHQQGASLRASGQGVPQQRHHPLSRSTADPRPGGRLSARPGTLKPCTETVGAS